jgi:probable addiction module antidote protein
MKSRAHEKSKNGASVRGPARAASHLNEILDSGDQAELLIALREMTREFGGIHQVAQRANLNRSQLYRTLSDRGNPAFRTLVAILRTMGLRVAVQPVAEKRTRTRARSHNGASRAPQIKNGRRGRRSGPHSAMPPP